MAEPRHAATPARRVAPGRRPLPPAVLVIAVTGVSAVLAAAVGVDWTVTPRFELFGGAPTGPASPWPAPDAEDLPPPDVVPLTWTGPAILGVLGVLGLVLVVVLVRWLWRIRPRRRVQVVASAADQESGPASYAKRAAALHRATKTALELLEETPEPRDAVIRTWLALEQAAATSGAARRPADTPTEFTRGLLVETSADPDAVTRLLDLYHRARFSAHRVGPVEVGQARGCVLRLSRSLTGYESALRRTVADPPAMTESTRPPPGFPLLAVAGLVALTVIGWVIGLAWAPALLVSGALVALLGLRRTPDTNADEDWPALPEGDADQGARREVARLSWALQGQAAQVEHRSLLRLRAVADHRLGLRGLHLAVPAEAAGCAQLLGLRAHRILTSDRHAVVTFDDFAISLDAVERLNDGGAAMGSVATEPQPTPLPVEEVSRLGRAVLAEVNTVVVEMAEPLEIALAAILAGGHVLFEDVPGLGKTLAARSLARTLGLDFRRLQCTPDLLPADITGSYVFDAGDATFVFRPGPVFTGLLLADEINRTAPKTQSALLEAMAERQVTVEGRSFTLAPPFHVLATSNPVEYEGTYPLPEAQLDRFMVRLAVGYPARAGEVDVLQRRLARRSEEVSLQPVVDAETVRRMQAGVETVAVDGDVVDYCVGLAAATRTHPGVEVGASPRGSLALLLVARAKAVLAGRDFVLPEDVKTVAVSALAHRITLDPQTWASGLQTTDVVATVLSQVPGPSATSGSPAPGR